MSNVMLDLETLGTSAGCSILSIGAAEFGKDGLKGAFYVVIQRRTCLNAGLVEDPDTLSWWGRQSPEAMKTLIEAGDLIASVPLGHALMQLDFWLGQVAGLEDIERKTLKVWGNGADFDLPILAEAYRRAGFSVPWAAYNGRCYRTLKNLMPSIKLKRGGVHHNALADARSQAEHAVRLLNEHYDAD